MEDVEILEWWFFTELLSETHGLLLRENLRYNAGPKCDLLWLFFKKTDRVYLD